MPTNCHKSGQTRANSPLIAKNTSSIKSNIWLTLLIVSILTKEKIIVLLSFRQRSHTLPKLIRVCTHNIHNVGAAVAWFSSVSWQNWFSVGRLHQQSIKESFCDSIKIITTTIRIKQSTRCLSSDPCLCSRKHCFGKLLCNIRYETCSRSIFCNIHVKRSNILQLRKAPPIFCCIIALLVFRSSNKVTKQYNIAIF